MDRVKRPRNQWVLFQSAMRKSVVVPRIPGESSKDEFGRIIKYISHLWRNASDDVIDYWIALAEQEKENHAQQNPDYKYKPRHRRRNKKNRDIGEDEETRPRRGRRKRRSSSVSPNVNTETAFRAAPAPSFPLNELYNHQDSNAMQFISEGAFNTVYSSLQEYPNTFFSQSTSSNTRFPSTGNPFNAGEPSFEGSPDTSFGFGIHTPISNRPLTPSVDPARISNQHQYYYYMGQSSFTSDISQQPYINYYTDQDFNDWLQLHTAQQSLMADGFSALVQFTRNWEVDKAVDAVTGPGPVGPQDENYSAQHDITNANQIWALANNRWAGENVGNHNI